jgi:Arc/MetJ family transcription regulator
MSLSGWKSELSPAFGVDASRGCGIEAPVIDWRIIHFLSRLVRTNIVLDDKLVKEAMKLAGVQIARKVVELALERFVRIGRQRKLLELYGSGGVWKGYDHKRSRSAT